MNSQDEIKKTDGLDSQLEEMLLQESMSGIGMKLLVLSGKGGVGKSTVAAKLAVGLAGEGLKIGLLDIDLHGPSQPRLFGLEEHVLQGDENQLYPARVLPNLSLMSIGFLLPDQKDAVIWRGPRKHSMIRQFLSQVKWGKLDYLIVDSPPGTGDEPLSVAQMVGRPAGAVVVTTPQMLAVADVRRCLTFCRSVELPILGVVENMSGWTCPDCGREVAVFKQGGGEHLARENQLNFFGRIPLDLNIMLGGDQGRLHLPEDQTTRVAQSFQKMTRAVLDGFPNKKTRRSSMKIAVPLVQGELSQHFGHCDEFAISEVEQETGRIMNQSRLKPPGHEPGVLPRWLQEQGVKVIISGGMGQRAQDLFTQAGIKTVVGVSSGSAEELVTAYLQKTLQPGKNLCDH